MTLNAGKAHVLRAGLESIAYQVKDLIDMMTRQAGIELKALRVDGGPTKNQFLMQFQADMLHAVINRSEIEEASALGAVVMNGFARKKWASFKKPLPCVPLTIASLPVWRKKNFNLCIVAGVRLLRK